MTTLLRMVAHLPPAFSRFVFGAPDQDYRGPLCSDPATAALTLLMLGAI